MIKAFAPILGSFSGRGTTTDGTELFCNFKGEEIIPNICYGFRLEARTCDSGQLIANVFIVATLEAGNKVAMQYIDVRERMQSMRWVENHQNGSALDSRIFEFEANRSAGGVYTILFDILSAQDFKLKFKGSTEWDPIPHEIWEMRLARLDLQAIALKPAA